MKNLAPRGKAKKRAVEDGTPRGHGTCRCT
jgi:hypothetical protein